MRTLPLFLAASVAAVALVSQPSARADSTSYLYGYGSEVQTPGHPLIFPYETDADPAHRVELKIFRISENEYVNLVRDEKTPVVADYAHRTPVATAWSGPPPKDQNWTRSVELEALPIGTYVALASVDKQTAISKLDVTTLGIAQARSYAARGDSVFFPTDIRTFDRFPGIVTMQVVDQKGAQQSIPVVDGLARWGAEISNAVAIVAHGSDGSLAAAQATGWSNTAAQTETGFVQADRPIYRPGDTIAIRAIVRDGWMDAYAIPTGSRHVRVEAPDGTSMYDHDVAMTSFGTLSASVRLPEDAQPGSYTVTIGSSISKSLLVAAYKKPEYELSFATSPEHVVGGTKAAFAVDAKYFFGRPAAGMHVHYVVYEQPHYYDWWFGPYDNMVESTGVWLRGERKELTKGDTTTGASGRASFDVQTTAAGGDRDVDVQVEARDASGRTVSTTANLLVTAAAFQVFVEPESWFGQAGTTSKILVHSREYNDQKRRPNVPVHVTVTGRRWEHDKEVETGTAQFDVTTGADGDGSFEWTPKDAGDYIIKATAKDDAGRTSTGESYLWVIGSGDESWLAPIEAPMLIAQQNHATPGSKTKLVVALPKPNRDVILVTSTDRLLEARVVRVRGTSTLVTVDVPAGATRFSAIALLPGENGIEQATTTIEIKPATKALNVTLTPGKSKYEPGERATFAVRATDDTGRPQRAEFGIGVVDESIYAVQQEDATNPLDVFYSGNAYVYGNATWFRPNRGQDEATKSAAGGLVENTVPAPMEATSIARLGKAAPPGQGPAVRSNFLDTAYWSPSIVTDDDGRATISFDWPDNLTTWRATGIGVTRAGDIGKGTGSTLVTKDFLVRLEMPRFMRAGDRSSLVGIAHGVKGNPDVRMQLDAGALVPGGPLDALLHLDQYQSASTSWPVTAPGVGSVLVTLSGSDGIRNDAMRLPLPLLAGTAAEHVRDAGSVTTRASLTVNVPPGYLAGAVHLSISPSLIAELVQNQRLLDVYPYYCTEQTMSAGLPAVFIGRVLHEAKLKAPGDVNVDDIVRHAVARLAQLQHGDGSWGWWENDDAHPFMTAYAMYGLAEFRKSGFVIGSQTYDRGVDNLVDQLANTSGETLAFWGGGQAGSEWNTRAFMLFALADAAPDRVDRGILERTRSHVGQLNPYALAVLGLAEHELGNDDAARSLLAALDRRAIHMTGFTYWSGDTWHYAWEDDPIETTAYALRLEVALGASQERIDPIVNFLRAQRRGDWWYTTKDTAAAIYALSEAIRPEAGEFDPDETVHVIVDGHTVRELHVTHPILDAADASVVVPASMVHGGTTIGFVRSGRGSLYWSSDAVRYVPTNASSAQDGVAPLFARLFAARPELAVSRRYVLKHGGAWRVGDEIRVEVTVRARKTVQYVAIEDPFPAGTEHQTEQGHAGEDAWSGIQFLDDRAAFFVDRLEAGQSAEVVYTLRATTPGRYAAPAPTAYAMYGPPVSALGRPEEVTVVP